MIHTAQLNFRDFLNHTTTQHKYLSAGQLYAGSTFSKPQLRQYLAEYLNQRLVMTGFTPISVASSSSDYETRNLRKYLSCKVAKDMVVQSGMEEVMTMKEIEENFFKFGKGYQIGLREP